MTTTPKVLQKALDQVDKLPDHWFGTESASLEDKDVRSDMIEELISSVNLGIDSLSERYDMYEEYLSSFCCCGEADPNFESVDNKALVSFLEDFWKKDINLAMKSLENYCSVIHCEDCRSVDGSIYSFDVSRVEEQVDLCDLLTRSEFELFESLSPEEFELFKKQLEHPHDDDCKIIYYCHSGMAHLVLDHESLIADLSEVSTAERLTDPSLFIRTFPLEDILNEQG